VRFLGQLQELPSFGCCDSLLKKGQRPVTIISGHSATPFLGKTTPGEAETMSAPMAMIIPERAELAVANIKARMEE